MQEMRPETSVKKLLQLTHIWDIDFLKNYRDHPEADPQIPMKGCLYSRNIHWVPCKTRKTFGLSEWWIDWGYNIFQVKSIRWVHKMQGMCFCINSVYLWGKPEHPSTRWNQIIKTRPLLLRSIWLRAKWNLRSSAIMCLVEVHGHACIMKKAFKLWS